MAHKSAAYCDHAAVADALREYLGKRTASQSMLGWPSPLLGLTSAGFSADLPDAHGRYSLNDLHRAAMAAAGRSGDPNRDHQRPGRFFESAGVQDFVAALNAENPAVSPVASVPGRKGGTYAAELTAEVLRLEA